MLVKKQIPQNGGYRDIIKAPYACQKQIPQKWRVLYCGILKEKP
jgi:hypothetical protein